MDTLAEACLISLPPKRKRKGADSFSKLEQESWFSCYKELWDSLEYKLEKLHKKMPEKMLDNIVQFIQSMVESPPTRIPILTLLTGVNLPDHELLFQLVTEKIEKTVNCRVASVQVTRETSTKHLIENIMCEFMYRLNVVENFDDEAENFGYKKKYKKSECTFPELREWYEELAKSSGNSKPYLVIIIPEIETISLETLNGLLDMLSTRKTDIPFVLVFGVATTVNVINKKLLSYRPKFFDCHVFKAQPTNMFLDDVLNQVFLTPACPFKLHGRVFNFLTDNFLYYNFSVNQFIRAIQLCILSHFSDSEINTLCCPYTKISAVVESLTEHQISVLLKLKSVGDLNLCRKKQVLPAVEKTRNVKEEVVKLLQDFHKRFARFHLAVRCLHVVNKSVPKAPLGAHVRQIYSEAMNKDFMRREDFKECSRHIRFLAKVELLKQMTTIEGILAENIEDDVIVEVLRKLDEFRKRLNSTELCSSYISPSKNQPVKACSSPRKSARANLSVCADGVNGVPTNSKYSLKVGNSGTSPLKRSGNDNISSNSVKTSRKYELASSPARKSPRKPLVSSTTPISSPRQSTDSTTKKKLDFTSPTAPIDSSATSNRETDSSLLNGHEEGTLKTNSSHIAGLKGNSGVTSSPTSRSTLMLNRIANNASQEAKSAISNMLEKDYAEFLFKDFFGTCLVPPTNYPLNEIFIYSDLNSIKCSLNAIPRSLLHTAMVNPQRILSCNCCKLKTSGDIPDTVPDIALAYKLLEEAAGIEVNMHDLLQTFNMKANGRNYDEIDVSPEIYARFMQAIRDLKFMGFIVPSKRKADHVVRIRL